MEKERLDEIKARLDIVERWKQVHTDLRDLIGEVERLQAENETLRATLAEEQRREKLLDSIFGPDEEEEYVDVPLDPFVADQDATADANKVDGLKP
jgi:regulator of replication initiation timing